MANAHGLNDHVRPIRFFPCYVVHKYLQHILGTNLRISYTRTMAFLMVMPLTRTHPRRNGSTPVQLYGRSSRSRSDKWRHPDLELRTKHRPQSHVSRH
ncbi:hypothetical protein BKA82DRAFT_904955 [Pisolithus tinctorius]|uniref:Uncharacterized protein n=1 Tax=Pisolithus tinctorius Marx 270 TaxID=870435 RepID=A0A0C3PNG3_PISTI|nr:hypothetical protein BKA82DRAFT_904955 [Pisolithus tinctorius]KIO10391.1 hypothetical protein M404DRAFT_904955 [Pisolithus tinctorius Marx 270]